MAASPWTRGFASRTQSGVASPRPGSGFPERRSAAARIRLEHRAGTLSAKPGGPMLVQAPRNHSGVRPDRLRRRLVARVSRGGSSGRSTALVRRPAASGHRRGRQRGRARRLFGDPRAGRVGRGARDALKGQDVRPSEQHAPPLAGDPVPSLLDELRRSDVTLVSVGPHGHSRMLGMLLGGMSTSLLHDAPCSVLLARKPRFGPFPSSILCGVDGSTSP